MHQRFSQTSLPKLILFLGIDGPESTQVLSGSSMASPKVEGYLATVLTTRGKMGPSTLSYALINNADPVVTGQPTDDTT